MNCVGVVGATSMVGQSVTDQLNRDGFRVVAFSRKLIRQRTDDVIWRQFDSASTHKDRVLSEMIEHWIFVAPIWIIPSYLGLLETNGARRIVALSSTSRFTKTNSTDAAENEIALRLADGEQCLQKWAEAKGVEWIILRPTLIYGEGKDRNIAEIARFIRRFGFFPMLGKGVGLRQPVHLNDVAAACVSALRVSDVRNRAYNISGGETLEYRKMVTRIFQAIGRKPRLISVPLVIFKFAVSCLRILPRFRKWSSAMAQRMNRDLVFDHHEAAQDFGFAPRGFFLTTKDIPES